MVSSFATAMLGTAAPKQVRTEVTLPRRQRFHPSPADWRDETLYFLLVDRFSDAQRKRGQNTVVSNIRGNCVLTLWHAVVRCPSCRISERQVQL